MRAEIRGDRTRVLMLPLLSRACAAAGAEPRSPLPRLAGLAGLSRDRIWKLSRNLAQPAPEEAERIARGAANVLGLPQERLLGFLEHGDEEVLAWLRARAPLPRTCTHCGAAPGKHSPLLRPCAVHEACEAALRDQRQAQWLEAVEACIDGAPSLLVRVWHAERQEERALNLFSLSTRAGLDYRCFRRAWVLARLPRRQVPRERPEPLSRSLRLAWTEQVERQLPQAPLSLQQLWQRARDAGVRLNLEQLAEFARVSPWRFRKRWVEAGLPTPTALRVQG